MKNYKEGMVSVIIPVFKVERYLSKCIKSVIAQTYKNIEIIIIDDGSPDNSGKIADYYAAKDKRIKVIHKENNGVAAARNTGIDNAEGEFIAYVDSDDWVSRDYVSHLLMLQKINNADMCMTTEFYIQKSDRQKKEKIKTISSEEAAVLLLSPKMTVGSYNKLYRRQWLLDNGIRQNESLFSGEGLNYIVTAAQYANCVTTSNRRIYYYRRNVAESATTKFNIRMFINNEYSLDLLEKNKIIESNRFDTMLNLFRVHLMISGMLSILIYSSPEKYHKEYSRWKNSVQYMGWKLLFSSVTPLKSKLRIAGIMLVPGIWSKLAKFKRDRIYIESV